MDAKTPAHEFETCRARTRRRRCPGCGATIDLSAYGCLRATATVVCQSCGRETRLADLTGS